MGLNERANSALNDIIAARAPGLNPVTQTTLRMMCMDVMYAMLRNQMTEEHPELAGVFEAWSIELASRTQAFMNSHGMVRAKQKQLGDLAKGIAHELMHRFSERVHTTQH